MLQAVVFDSDGTLFPSSKRQERWFRQYSRMHDIDWPFHDFAEFLYSYNMHCAMPGGVQNFYDMLGLPCDMKDKKHPVWPAYEEFNQANPLEPYQGIVETIKTIWQLGSLDLGLGRERRLRLGINTTNSWKSIAADLDKAGIRPYFDARITEETLREFQGAGNVEHIKKPSRISLALILGLLDSEADSTIHIGDTRNDLAASQKVMRLNPKNPKNLITVGACYGYEGRTVLEQGAEVDGRTVKFDYLIDHPSELVQIVTSYLMKKE